MAKRQKSTPTTFTDPTPEPVVLKPAPPQSISDFILRFNEDIDAVKLGEQFGLTTSECQLLLKHLQDMRFVLHQAAARES